MKAISLKQPWANMIVAHEKTIETRTWPTRYRGELLICSSRLPAIEPAGFALVLCRLVDCRPMTVEDEKAACCPVYPGAFSWVLEDIRPIVPIAVKGMLGIFKVDIRLDQIVFLDRKA